MHAVDQRRKYFSDYDYETIVTIMTIVCGFFLTTDKLELYFQVYSSNIYFLHITYYISILPLPFNIWPLLDLPQENVDGAVNVIRLDVANNAVQ